MNPIEINVNVRVGVESALLGALSALGSLAAQAAPTTQAIEAEAAATETKAAKKKPKTEPAPEAKEPPAAPAKAAEEKELTAVDVRAAMERTRKRIEGEDYATNTSSEGYKQWHKPLTGWFKNAAAVLGADKPTALPDHESRKNFIKICDNTVVKDGQLTQLPPF